MYSNYKELRKVQQATLNVACQIVRFCKENNILCYLCGGGAIGTIRERGFVPWDDDLDFFMPRSDYEKFYKLWKAQPLNERYAVEKVSRGFVNHNNFMTVRDSETTFIKTYQADLDVVHGIAIDIFPLDVAPENAFRRKTQKLWALIYALFSEQVIPEDHGAAISFGSRFLLILFSSSESRYKIWRFAEKRMTSYNNTDSPFVTELCVGPKYMGNLYNSKDFKKSVFFPFEDTKMPLPVGYDHYLTKVFGNYMQRPAIKEQVPHHDTVFIDTDRSYRQYRGQYYLKEEDK